MIFTFGPAGSDDVVVFQAFKAGGRRAVYSIPLKTPVKNVTRIFGEGDAAPSIGGTIVGFGFNFSSINDSEEVPFFAGSIVGGSVYPANGVFTHKPGFGLRKVAATGDAAPGVPGGIFGLGINFALGGPSASKITSVGKVAFFANIMGLLGGAIMCWATLDISIPTFLRQLRSPLPGWSFWVGIMKAPAFAGIIALTGCYEGLRVSRSAESVGRLTTRSVVESIFLIILADAVFSIIFSYAKI